MLTYLKDYQKFIPLVGKFSVNRINHKTGMVIDSFSEKNIIVLDAKEAIIKAISGSILGHIDTIKLGEDVGDDVNLQGSPNITFNDNNPSADTIVRDAGSFIDDGFYVGVKIRVLYAGNNDGIYTITNVTALTLTLDSGDSLIDDGPINGINIKSYGDISYYDVTQDAPDVPITRQYAIGSSGLQKYIPIRKNNTLDITVPSDCTVIVYGSTNERREIAQGNYDWTILATYSNVTNQILEINNKFAVGFNITVPSAIDTVDLTITLH